MEFDSLRCQYKLDKCVIYCYWRCIFFKKILFLGFIRILNLLLLSCIYKKQKNKNINKVRIGVGFNITTVVEIKKRSCRALFHLLGSICMCRYDCSWRGRGARGIHYISPF